MSEEIDDVGMKGKLAEDALSLEETARGKRLGK